MDAIVVVDMQGVIQRINLLTAMVRKAIRHGHSDQTLWQGGRRFRAAY